MNRFLTIAKLVALLILSSVILASFNLVFLITVLIILLAAICFTKSRGQIFYRIKSLIPAGILIFIFQIILNPGIPLNIKTMFAFTVFTKLVLVSLMVLYFVATVSPAKIVSAFFFLSENMRLMLTMTFYFIPLIFEEAKHIIAVQKSRGFRNFSWNIFPLAVPLLHRIFMRAQFVAFTLVSRGFKN